MSTLREQLETCSSGWAGLDLDDDSARLDFAVTCARLALEAAIQAIDTMRPPIVLDKADRECMAGVIDSGTAVRALLPSLSTTPGKGPE